MDGELCFRALVLYAYSNLSSMLRFLMNLLLSSLPFPSFMKFFCSLKIYFNNALDHVIIMLTLFGKVMIQIKCKMKTCFIELKLHLMNLTIIMM